LREVGLSFLGSRRELHPIGTARRGAAPLCFLRVIGS
jgi:hypothetical protein